MKRLFIILLSTFFLFCVSSGAQGQEENKENWTKVQTKHFTLIGVVDEIKLKELGVSLEQFRASLEHLSSDINLNASVETIVVVFKDQVAFKPFNIRNGAGYFQTGRNANYITLTNETVGEQNPQRVIYHEYVHSLIRNTFGRDVPLWFSEGLAEYYSTLKIKDAQNILLGGGVRSHIRQIRKQGLQIPLKTLFSIGDDSPYYSEDDKKNIFYAQSWLLMHYLIQKKGMPAIKKFIHALKDTAETEKAFTQSFQMNFAAAETELLQYLKKKDTFKPEFIKLENKLDFAIADVKCEAIEEAEVFVYLGELLALLNRSGSEEYLKRAAELDPKLPTAQAALGIQKAKAGNYAEAKIYLQRAVEAGTKNHLAHFYYAESINAEKAKTGFANGFTAEELKTMRAALKRAIELEPKFTDSYRLLAYINLIANEQPDESVVFLNRGLSYEPGNQDLIMMLAQSYLAKNDFVNAKTTLETIARTGTNEHYKAEAKAALNSLRETELSVARGKAAVKDVQQEAEEIAKQGFKNPTPTRKASSPAQFGLRQPSEDEKQIRGQLLEIQCQKNNNVILLVKSGEEVYRFFNTNLLGVNFVTFTARFSVGGEMNCGTISKENEIIATYRPTTDPATKHNGEIILIEFIPKDFPIAP